jgi:hypothetical protein
MKPHPKAKRPSSRAVLKRKRSKLGESYYFAANRGRLSVFSYREGRQKTVGIYGDPKGLRYLAQLLNDVAAVNQSKVPDLNCPPTEGVHYHVYNHSGFIDPKSDSLVVGRADAKRGGIWFETLK